MKRLATHGPGLLFILLILVAMYVVWQPFFQIADASPALRVTYSYAVVALPARTDLTLSTMQQQLNAYGRQGYRQIYVIEPEVGAWGDKNGYIILERIQ